MFFNVIIIIELLLLKKVLIYCSFQKYYELYKAS